MTRKPSPRRAGGGKRRFAVLMGDLVGSEAAREGGALSRKFNKAVERINRGEADLLASPLTITLGDEFQGLFRTGAAAFEAAQKMRLELMDEGVRCRFVIGFVALDTPLNPERAWNMMGEGLAEARARLNDKRDPNAYRFVWREDAALERLMNAAGYAMTAIEDGWTQTQLRYVRDLRASRAQVAAVARRRRVSQNAVYKSLRAAQHDFYEAQRDALDAALARLDARWELTT